MVSHHKKFSFPILYMFQKRPHYLHEVVVRSIYILANLFRPYVVGFLWVIVVFVVVFSICFYVTWDEGLLATIYLPSRGRGKVYIYSILLRSHQFDFTEYVVFVKFKKESLYFHQIGVWSTYTLPYFLKIHVWNFTKFILWNFIRYYC